MEQQDSLFHERVEDAAAAVIDRCGGRKKFAAEMWPDRSVGDAHNLLNACLNPEKRERFSPDQLLYILRKGRAVGCHTLITFMAREAGYTDPQPIEPEDERAKLQREYVEAAKAMGRMAERIEQLAQPTLVRAAR
jgi:hypothetical protein